LNVDFMRLSSFYRLRCKSSSECLPSRNYDASQKTQRTGFGFESMLSLSGNYHTSLDEF